MEEVQTNLNLEAVKTFKGPQRQKETRMKGSLLLHSALVTVMQSYHFGKKPQFQIGLIEYCRQINNSKTKFGLMVASGVQRCHFAHIDCAAM